MPAPRLSGRGDGLTGRTARSAALAAVLLLAGCSSAEKTPAPVPLPSARATVSSVSPTPVGTEAEARTRLRALQVAPRRPPVGYVRDAFGSAWLDIDGNGCNQRDDVLLRDAVAGTARYAQQGRCDHDVLAGTWVDPYTGRTLVFTDLNDPAQAQAIQIDHLVPLAEAWASGASRWAPDRRKQFANDLGELLAVDGPTNASKGDGDPAAWRPRKDYQCAYAMGWIDTKTRWDLTVDRPEKRALLQMLGYC